MKIKITHFKGFNPEAFANITEGSVHDVIRETDDGWIIKGSNGDDVLVMYREAEEVL